MVTKGDKVYRIVPAFETGTGKFHLQSRTLENTIVLLLGSTAPIKFTSTLAMMLPV